MKSCGQGNGVRLVRRHVPHEHTQVPDGRYWPTKSTVAALTDVYRVALGLDSWGLTIPVLSRPLDLGGCHVLCPETYLYTGFGLLAVRLLTGSFSFPAVAQSRLFEDCRSLCVVFEPSSLQHFQLEPVLEVQLSYGLWALKAYSCEKCTVSIVLDGTTPDSILLWQSSVFRDGRRVSYYYPYLILRGVVSLGSPRRSPKYLRRIGTAWRSKYRLALCGRCLKGVFR